MQKENRSKFEGLRFKSHIFVRTQIELFKWKIKLLLLKWILDEEEYDEYLYNITKSTIKNIEEILKVEEKEGNTDRVKMLRDLLKRIKGKH